VPTTHHLTIDLPAAAYDELQHQAAESSQTVEQTATDTLGNALFAACGVFELKGQVEAMSTSLTAMEALAEVFELKGQVEAMSARLAAIEALAGVLAATGVPR